MRGVNLPSPTARGLPGLDRVITTTTTGPDGGFEPPPPRWARRQMGIGVIDLAIGHGSGERDEKERRRSCRLIPALLCKSLHAGAVKLQKAADETPLLSSDQDSARGARPGH